MPPSQRGLPWLPYGKAVPSCIAPLTVVLGLYRAHTQYDAFDQYLLSVLLPTERQRATPVLVTSPFYHQHPALCMTANTRYIFAKWLNEQSSLHQRNLRGFSRVFPLRYFHLHVGLLKTSSLQRNYKNGIHNRLNTPTSMVFYINKAILAPKRWSI